MDLPLYGVPSPLNGERSTPLEQCNLVEDSEQVSVNDRSRSLSPRGFTAEWTLRDLSIAASTHTNICCFFVGNIL